MLLLPLQVHLHASGGNRLFFVLDANPILQASLFAELFFCFLKPSLRSFSRVAEQAGLRGLREGVVGESLFARRGARAQGFVFFFWRRRTAWPFPARLPFSRGERLPLFPFSAFPLD